MMKILYCIFFDYDGVHKMAEIKKYNVKDGEVLTCSLGSQNSILHVPVSHGSSVRGKNEATINDCRPGVNILPFGLCKRESPPVPCMERKLDLHQVLWKLFVRIRKRVKNRRK